MAHYTHKGAGLPTRNNSRVTPRVQHSFFSVARCKPIALSVVNGTLEVSRRAILAVIVGLGAGSTSAAYADTAPSEREPAPAVAFPLSTPPQEPSPSDPTIFTYDFASDVPCNLRVREYWSIISQQRPRTWQQIAQQIQSGSYSNLSINMNVAPMADLRQAALYLPWALLQNSDYTAAVDSFKAYKDFDEHVKDLQRAAAAAAAFTPTDPPQQSASQKAQLAQQVQQAFILMSASLDRYLAAIPAKYTSSLGLFQQSGAAAPGRSGVVEADTQTAP